ncbi:hypothetical protein BpHYR1_019483 [Brachionus plicatilis]|uniref:Uncharacterized protein n=1 Tax=Brachionus plicatilis TaxID=10195 RepID=A0A3M7RBX7_BRAPC|nr:hypothetical protein BpHYR1_019483 [Brachionus plicatilis]
MYQSQSINDQYIYQDFATQNRGSEVPYPSYYYSYDYNNYGTYHTSCQSYQLPNIYYGEYNFSNSNSYPNTGYYSKTTYSDNTLGTSSLDSTGNSLNNSNSQVILSPNRNDNSEELLNKEATIA